jgi:Mrp family chromosome partitioning ATPase
VTPEDEPLEHRVFWDEELLGLPRAHLVRLPKTSAARVPARAPAVDPRLVLLADPDSDRAASFRLLCDNLIERGLPRILAVSSAAKHEGKTTCALNLAVTLAERTTSRVLLIDGNFFEPGLAAIFGIHGRSAVSPALDLPWLAPFKLAELTPALHVAALVEEGGARLEPHRFDVLIDRLCELDYERLVIDAPALNGSAAARRIVALADGVLLTVRSGRTTTRALRRATEQVAKGKALGVALVDAKP